MSTLKNIETEKQFTDKKSNLETLISKGMYVGNVLFTDEGIVIVKPYNINYEVGYEENIQEQEKLLIEDLHLLIEQRMKHCVEELNKHINDEDVIICSEQVIWSSGHFTLEIYKTMYNFQSYPNLNFLDLNNLFGSRKMYWIYQQAIRHLYWCLQNEIIINGLNYSQDELFRKLTDRIIR